MDTKNPPLKNHLLNLFNFLKEEKHLGVITWIASILATFSVILLKFIRYTYERGYISYWKLPTSVISIIDDNILYDIILTIAFAMILTAILLIPFYIMKASWRIIWKIIAYLAINLTISIWFFFESEANIMINHLGWKGIVAFVFADIILLAVFYLPSVLHYIPIPPSKKPQTSYSLKKVLIVLIILLLSYIIYFYYAGVNSAKSQYQYRIINSEYAIIYETNDCYYLAKYDKTNNCIIKEFQKTIPKDNIEYVWMTVQN